ncbi:MAG: GGDEF domain-containing protein [Rubrivivax sp.]|nr:GGDEF domain-containing protein [Rubrivivax sp.]
MDLLALQLAAFSTAEVVLLLVALQYAVLAPAWVAAAVVLPGERRATGWWAAYASASALGLLMIVLAMHHGHPPLRAAGNVAVVAATLALQRGLWAYTGQRAWTGVQVLVLAITAVLAWLAMDAAWVWLRITVVSALWAGLYLWSAVDVFRHVRQHLQRRWSGLYASPMLLAGAMLALRSVRALLSPETVMAEVEQNTVLNLGSSATGLVAALLLQMMLVGLLVSRLVGRLARLSRYDPLTGLLNRRAMDELLAQEEQRVRRLAVPGAARGAARMAVLMIDIDHFKRLNDGHGHAVGDRALLHLAALMASKLRDIDHLARWGGEEFLALLPATSAAEAQALAERLCERVRSLPLATDGGRLTLTASIGVAEWLGPHDSLHALIGRADAALYAAKRDGRDRVHLAPVTHTLAAVKSA